MWGRVSVTGELLLQEGSVGKSECHRGVVVAGGKCGEE